jgi:predicted negative regulator of RcsB-dependent stress response
MRIGSVDQSTLNMIFGAVLAVAGWFARQLWEAVQSLKIDLHKIEVDLPISYVRKDDLDKRMDHIETMFQRIYDKLDGKADK